MSFHYRILTKSHELRQLSQVFGHVFEDERSVNEGNLTQILGDSHVYPLGAFAGETLIGGLIAYEFLLMDGRREFYLYDIGVLPEFQKQGIGTGLIEELKKEAQKRGVKTIFVEAGADDETAVAFYRSLNEEELLVRHFNIHVQ